MTIKAERLALGDAEAWLYQGVFPESEAIQLFDRLDRSLDWQAARIKLFGREVMSPRLSAWYGERSYTYSGVTWPARAMPAELTQVQSRLTALTNTSFNTVLANLYRDGRDSMGWHADDEPELGADPIIASVVFGATRRFQFRRKDDHGEKLEVALTSGDVLIMAAGCQAYWQHGVPKTQKPVGRRINLTYRWINERQ